MKKSVIKRNNNKPVYKTEWDSITEMVNYIKNGKRNLKSFPTKESSKSGDYNFTLTNSLDYALELLLNGWSDGAKQLTKMLNIENSKLQSKEVIRSINDIVGFQVNVPRYLQGIPTHMVNQKRVTQKAKIVTLVKSISYHAGIKPHEILKDSVKFLQIIQGIEKKGIRVNAYVSWHTMKDTEEFYGVVKIKSASERLNISKMSFPLMHPSFLRRICFRALEVEERLTRSDWQMGYGRPASTETNQLLSGNEYYVPVLVSDHKIKDIFSNIN